MANFKAWKIYMLHLIDKMAEEHKLSGPFIDAGCGSGDVSVHFATKGWSGTAVDFSEQAVEAAGAALRGFPTVQVAHGDLFSLRIPPAGTVFLMDVIEHVKDDEDFLRKISGNLRPGGHLVITVPVKPAEWRWDDDFYGHYRRYVPADLEALMERNGFRVLSMWDCSFPLFWLMRRIYTRIFPRPLIADGPPEERTKISTRQSAWDCSHFSGWIDRIFTWTGLYMVHYPFRKGRWGCEVLLVARKEREISG